MAAADAKPERAFPPGTNADTMRRSSGVFGLVYSYALPVARVALRKRTALTSADVPPCPRSDDAAVQARAIKELLKQKKNAVSAYIRFVWTLFRWAFLLQFIGVAIMFAQPFANKQLVLVLYEYYQGERTD